jgi:outer membrane protein assembly factor BamB
MRTSLLILVAASAALFLAAPAGAETITGTFHFQDRRPTAKGPVWTTQRPIAFAKVEVWSCAPGCLWWGWEKTTTTDAAGTINVSINRPAGTQYRLRVYATNAAAEVWPKMAAPQGPYFQEPGQPAGAVITRTVTSPGDVLLFDYDFDDYWSAAHFNIADALLVARSYADANRDPGETDTIGRVKVQPTSLWPGVAFFDPVNDTITVLDGDMFEDFTLIHEYGHFLQDQISTFAPLPAMHDGCFAKVPTTGVFMNSAPHAWMEGFADYFSGVVQTLNPGRLEGGAAGTTTTGDLETPPVATAPFCAGVTSQFPGDAIEFLVSSALWDVFDKVGDPLAPGTSIVSSSVTAEPTDSLARLDREVFGIFDRELDTTGWPTITAFREAWLKRKLPAAALGSIFTGNSLPLRINHPAIANAGAPQTVDEGKQVVLDASASEDPENGTLGFGWSQISGPPVTMFGANTVRPDFAAPQVGPAGATLVFQVDVSDPTFAGSSDTVAVTVHDLAASPSVSPTSLGFGLRKVGTTTVKSVTLSNAGPGVLAITGTTSSDAVHFGVGSWCWPTLGPKSDCKIDVAFKPDAAATFSATLKIQTDAGTFSIGLTGQGGAPVGTLSTTVIDFGPSNIGSSVSEQVRLTNTGDVPLAVTGVVNMASSQFTVGSCPATIPPTGHCDVTVTYAPVIAGGAGGWVRFDHDGGPDRWVWLAGSGVPVGAASASPASLSFGQLEVAGRSPVKTVTLGNTGGAPLTVGSVGIWKGHWADFELTDNCSGKTIPAGATAGCTVDVRFVPQAGGPREAELRIGTVAVPLEGTGVAAAVPSPWPQFGGGAARGGFNPSESAIDSSAAAALNPEWTSPTPARVQSSPAVVEGVAYAGSDDGTLYAVDTSSGKQLWSAATAGAIVSSPAFADGVVFAGSNDGSVYAFDAKSGAHVWTFKTGGDVVASPAVDRGLVVAGSLDGRVYALDGATGKPAWVAAIGAPVRSSAAVVDGVAYVGADDGRVRAYEAATGHLLWTFVANGPVRSTPAVAGGFVYFGSAGGRVYAVDAASGAQHWSYAANGPVDSSPAVAYGFVFVGSDGGDLYALEAAAGAPRWTVPVGAMNSAPAVANGVVYVTTGDGRLVGYDAWKPIAAPTELVTLGVRAASSAAVADGLVVVGTDDGLVGIRP